MSGLIEYSADARSKTIGSNFRVRAWVNFQGNGSVAIRDSGNVSSITDNYTGNYFVNFTYDRPDSDYATHFSAGNYNSAGVRGHKILFNQEPNRVRVENRGESGNEEDPPLACVAVFQ
tara:strand:+ start:725 stop:1078 length:354 start_codon:yes stop_codon:yes gene_type:complete